jgi:hypothetical protein
VFPPLIQRKRFPAAIIVVANRQRTALDLNPYDIDVLEIVSCGFPLRLEDFSVIPQRLWMGVWRMESRVESLPGCWIPKGPHAPLVNKDQSNRLEEMEDRPHNPSELGQTDH